jgi:hypothetical protein
MAFNGFGLCLGGSEIPASLGERDRQVRNGSTWDETSRTPHDWKNRFKPTRESNATGAGETES